MGQWPEDTRSGFCGPTGKRRLSSAVSAVPANGWAQSPDKRACRSQSLRLAIEMNAARVAIAILHRPEAIAPPGYLLVKPLPQDQTARNVQQRRQPPQAAQSA